MMTESKFNKQFRIFLIFIIIAVFIVILHFLFHPYRVLDMDTSIFYMDEKYTLASFFTTVTAFLVGYLCLIKSFSTEKKLRDNLGNIGFGLFFLILSFDEYFEVHEYINTIIKSSFKKNGLFGVLSSISWVFSLFLVILVVFLLFIIKIKNTGKELRKPLIYGCFSFLFVMLFELMGSVTYGQNIYLYFVAIEEGMEMIGVSFFLLAALLEEK